MRENKKKISLKHVSGSGEGCSNVTSDLLHKLLCVEMIEAVELKLLVISSMNGKFVLVFLHLNKHMQRLRGI